MHTPQDGIDSAAGLGADQESCCWV